ncbi:MAG TPA: FUSC family protein [Rhodopila sp.]|uniref:FUSC family protein n=1 Tax=Rhodopila sp. TaxID=2480087 RepID=UPI002BB4D218|nr:FUSC family protein [Rhodopila sp.]HVY17163.1 FUSC family protein [Rhodopila sp.]
MTTWLDRFNERYVALLKAAAPMLLFGVRLWAAVCLALYVSFWLQLQNPYWAGTSAAIVCQPVLGASLRKGWFRMIGTVLGAIFSVILTAAFPQNRVAFLVLLVAWGAACGFTASLLRNFAAYAAALAGYTAVIICVDVLGSVAIASPGDVFILAVTRATEICVGIVCAGVVLAGTDVGHARGRFAQRLAALATEVTQGLTTALSQPRTAQAESRSVRRTMIRRVAELDTIIDQVLGESPTLRFRPRALQAAMDGLFQVISGWRAVATHIERQPGAAEIATGAILPRIPHVLRAASADAVPDWIMEAASVRQQGIAAARALVARPAETPSGRLLADHTADALLGLARVLQGIAVLEDPSRAVPGHDFAALRVPDVLPALVNMARVAVTMGAATLLWVVTAWPSGGSALVFAAVTAILFSPQQEAAFAGARGFMVGTTISAVFAGIIAFLVLPHATTFPLFCLASALVLVPGGALSSGSWNTPVFIALTANFIPLLGPTNPMVFDLGAYLNSTFGLLSGVALALLGIRLVRPVPPAERALRLAALTLRDLRRLAMRPLNRPVTAWQNHVYGRLAPMPEHGALVQGARLMAALSVGTEVIRLSRAASRLDCVPAVEAIAADIARGRVLAAVEALERLDQALVERAAEARMARTIMAARANIAAMREALLQHGDYFEGEVRA